MPHPVAIPPRPLTATGELRPAPEDPEQTLSLFAEYAELVSQQGAYVNADNAESE